MEIHEPSRTSSLTPESQLHVTVDVTSNQVPLFREPMSQLADKTSFATGSIAHTGNTESTLGAANRFLKPKTEALPRLYKVYPSNNLFLLRGRIVTGTNPWMFLVTIFLLALPGSLFASFVCPYYWENVTIAIPIGFIILFVHTFALMLRTSFTDPGILPRNLDEDNPWGVPSLGADARIGSYPPPKFTRVNGVEVQLKYCETCRIYRPPRASHCRQCDNCIEREDHHCIWLNNCIGRRNYRYFFLFLASALALCAYIATLSSLHLAWTAAALREQGRYNSFLDALRAAPVSSLFGFHCYLMARNLTTHERLRGGEGPANPFDRGNCLFNCFEGLCRTPPAPHLRWRSRDPSQLYHYQPSLAYPTTPHPSAT
ncbi:Eukaryotic peptide chain release factor GTP-binding subunit [Massospora cicadina]|nr:Eukaryotic peptide chain release factor GTP-binding subunit [Massospora cicadina]